MIKRVTLKQQSYDYLLNAITEEKIKPLEVYSEQYFADILEISRTPIREAVLQLSQEGFLQIHPNKGFSVKPMSNKEVEDIFGLRCAIEGYCAMYAAEKIRTIEGKALVKKLRHLIGIEKTAYDEHVSPSLWMENDTLFHRALLEFSTNGQFTSIMENLRAKIKLVGMRSLYKDGRAEGTMNEHEALLRAIESGDRMEAYEAVKNHFDECQRIIIEGRR